jgi:colicin import membrane protein
MAGDAPTPTISLRERSFPLVGSEEKLSKWVVFSLFLHAAVIASLFIMPFLPSRSGPAVPIYTVDLVGGEKIGGTNFGAELAPAPIPETKKETKKEKAEKARTLEKKAPAEEKIALKESAKKEPAKKESTKEAKAQAKSESASLDSIRERIIQSGVERAKSRTESAQKTSKGEVISSAPGEGEGAAALGQGGRGGGVVRGPDFFLYQNKIQSTIRQNWAWPSAGQKSNLKVLVGFGIKDSGEIVGVRILEPSGDPSYDLSVLRAVRKSSPLPAPPENYRKDFSQVEINFQP